MKRFTISVLCSGALLLATAALPAPRRASERRTVTVESLTDSLASLPAWHARADYSVSMPQMLDDVIYRLSLASMAAPADTLAPCSYLIDWELQTESNHRSSGFSAYDSGHHYRYSSGRRMQEYHFDWDSVPFLPRLSGSSRAVAVQTSARFAELLPQMIAAALRSMASDPDYKLVLHADTTVAGVPGRIVIDMQRTVPGQEEIAQEGEYVFDGATLHPLRVTMENNPGSISEQTIITTYMPDEGPAPERPTEQMLMARYPDVFASWRESNYRIETLPGHAFPQFSLPSLDGDRLEHTQGEPLNAPTLVVIYDPDDTFTPATLRAVREAMEQLPVAAEVIYAATATNPAVVEELLPSALPGEHRLYSARVLASDCGVTATPALILVDRSGRVADVMVGYSDGLRSSLTQKMSILP